MTGALQVFPPADIASFFWTTGATAEISGASKCEARAVASARVRVEADPRPPRTPPVPVELPGETTNKLLPREETAAVTLAWDPSPSPTVMITAAIPINIPSTVSRDLDRWVAIASIDALKVSLRLIICDPSIHPMARIPPGAAQAERLRQK